MLISSDTLKPEMAFIAKTLVDLGCKLYCSSPDVEAYLKGLPYVTAKQIFFPTKDKRLFDEYDIQCVINLSKTRGKGFTDEDYVARRNPVDFGLPLLHNARCAKLWVEALQRKIPHGGLRKYEEGKCGRGGNLSVGGHEESHV